MIVDPDFMDHWRTVMVVNAIGDPLAPVYILRLWAHCQLRKSDRFVMPTAGVRAQCKCPADAEVFERALIEAGFLERQGETVIVLGWAEQNAALLAAWENGAKGGRPKNPEKTHGKPKRNPADNPGKTAGQPGANPGETDKSREEKNSSSLRSEEIPGFDLFWSLWPRHDRKSAKKQCEEKWQSKGCDDVADQVIASLRDWIDSEAWAKSDGEFIPAPLVWLNQSRWEGSPPKRAKPQAGSHAGFDSMDYHAGANEDGSF